MMPSIAEGVACNNCGKVGNLKWGPDWGKARGWFCDDCLKSMEEETEGPEG